MSVSILCYFVDTNLFFQCRPLDQLDWSPWKAFDEVQLVVSKPVLREIDYRKNKSSDRVGRRARSAVAMFREIRSTGQKVVHADGPRVVLSIEPHHQPSDTLVSQLDYTERDDQLVGTAYEYMQRNRVSDVRLLTHDTTLLYVAQSINLAADSIVDDWLLPPESTKTEKRLRALEIENARFRQSEPSFAIRFLGQDGQETERYEAFYKWFEPLTDAEFDELMQYLKDRFPLETDFGSREPAERTAAPGIGSLFVGATRTFVPATDEEIKSYRDVAYPGWLASCEATLRHHHLFLQLGVPPLEFSFVVENQGTRPATDALITFSANGGLQVTPPSTAEEDGGVEGGRDDSSEWPSETLPEPPVAPRGHWRRTVGIGLAQLEQLTRSVSHVRNNLEAINRYDSVPDLIRGARRDANAFYHKPDRPSTPRDAFSLECEQWRHDDGDEAFVGEIHIPREHDQVDGALVCRIQAGNLSTSESKTIPVRIETTRVSAFDSAREMVACLLLEKGTQTGQS